MALNLLAATALAVWIYLIVGRGGFWLAVERDDSGPAPATWPSVMTIIPARDEAESVGETVASLLRQDYAGAFSVILVDDQSSDGTADVARRAAAAAAADRLTIVPGAALPAGWTGKLWAMKQGIERALIGEPTYLLFTDADIVYDRSAVTRLVSQAQANGLVLNSLMVTLRCESFAERAFVPAFIFFFQMLYPFAWVNDRTRSTAAAAGGCMLVRRDALVGAGGIEAIRGSLIDDCALARKLKPQGPIRLSLTQRVHSIRGYATVQDIRRMVARSAYAQLRYSPLLLAATVAGMALVYLMPVVLALFGHGLAQTLGLLAWALMTVAFLPILRFYRLSTLWGPFLPLITLAYMAFTVDSAYQYARKRGGLWKGRVQSNVNGVR
jgi:hopene-associated glycosyltransferase HpnB